MERDTTGETVELAYRPTVEDFTAALRARRRVSRSARRQLWLMVFAIISAALGVAAGLANGGAMPVPLLLGLFTFALLLAFQPWLQARQLYRVAEPRGMFRVTVTDVGVSAITDNTTTSVNWIAQPRYRETADAFFLFTGDRNACGFTLLPKRALRDPADVDRLRALLDRNLTRV